MRDDAPRYEDKGENPNGFKSVFERLGGILEAKWASLRRLGGILEGRGASWRRHVGQDEPR